jgi:hypothetical protein
VPFLRRQIVTAALTANAVRPLPGFRAGIPVFVAGWLTSELAPHLLALTAADAVAHARGLRRNPAGLALAAASMAGLGFLVDQARRVRDTAEAALVEGIGVDYVEQLDAKPTPAELAVPWRKLVYPFRIRDVQVTVERNIPYADGTGRRGFLDVYRSADRAIAGAPVPTWST